MGLLLFKLMPTGKIKERFQLDLQAFELLCTCQHLTPGVFVRQHHLFSYRHSCAYAVWTRSASLLKVKEMVHAAVI